MNPISPFARLPRVAGFICLFIQMGCSSGGCGTQGTPAPDPVAGLPAPEVSDTLIPAQAMEELEVGADTLIPDPVVVFDSWADSVLSTLSLDEKAGQQSPPVKSHPTSRA